jgi:hypothetical protein
MSATSLPNDPTGALASVSFVSSGFDGVDPMGWTMMSMTPTLG